MDPASTGLQLARPDARRHAAGRIRRQLVAHLTLQGNFIWGLKAPELHTDGETFGFPAGAAGATVGIRFPSGDGRRGGDLRIWFRIGPTPGVRASGRRRSTSTSKRTRQP